MAKHDDFTRYLPFYRTESPIYSLEIPVFECFFGVKKVDFRVNFFSAYLCTKFNGGTK